MTSILGSQGHKWVCKKCLPLATFAVCFFFSSCSTFTWFPKPVLLLNLLRNFKCSRLLIPQFHHEHPSFAATLVLIIYSANNKVLVQQRTILNLFRGSLQRTSEKLFKNPATQFLLHHLCLHIHCLTKSFHDFPTSKNHQNCNTNCNGA